MLQLRAVDLGQLEELGEIERALDAIDLSLVRLETALEPSDHLGRRRRAHLDAHDVAEASAAKLGLNRFEKVGGVVGHLEVGIARHPEHCALDDVDAGEECGQEVGDDLLERNMKAVAAKREEAPETFGDLHAREALVARLRVLSEDREREREARDVRERLTGADRERCEHRVDLAVKLTLELLELLRAQVFDAANGDSLGSEGWTKLAFPELRLQCQQLENALPDASERLLGCEPVRRANQDARLGLPEESRDPHLEELVEVRGEDRAELHTLEQRQRLVRRQLENASVELEV